MSEYKAVTIIRGASGTGKTTLANTFWGRDVIDINLEADDYFYKGRVKSLLSYINGGDRPPVDRGVYEFDYTKLNDAHATCRVLAAIAVGRGMRVAVSNTSIKLDHVDIIIDYINHFHDIKIEYEVIDLTTPYGISNAPLEVQQRMLLDFEPWTGSV